MDSSEPPTSQAIVQNLKELASQNVDLATLLRTWATWRLAGNTPRAPEHLGRFRSWKRCWEKLEEAGLSIAYPTQTLYLRRDAGRD